MSVLKTHFKLYRCNVFQHQTSLFQHDKICQSVCKTGSMWLENRAVESLKTFLCLHTELLPAESCDICVIEIPHSRVQISHWTHARCLVSSRKCWQRTTKSSHTPSHINLNCKVFSVKISNTDNAVNFCTNFATGGREKVSVSFTRVNSSQKLEVSRQMLTEWQCNKLQRWKAQASMCVWVKANEEGCQTEPALGTPAYSHAALHSYIFNSLPSFV